MTSADFLLWIQQNPAVGMAAVVSASVIVFVLARLVIGRGLVFLAGRTKTKVDDILVKHLRPYRISLLAPLLIIYAGAALYPPTQSFVQKASLFLILWVVVFTLNSLLGAINEIYESSKNYNGVSIESYLDLAKILFVVVAIILSITLITDESPVVLLTGLGALMAVLLLVFQNTILSIVASIQIVANDLLKEGDWIEVPSYDADGDVVNIGLHTIKVRNFDMTYSVIPTSKVVEVAYKNWRGMRESGGRRIQRSVSVDVNSLKFCEPELLKRLRKIDLIHDWVDDKMKRKSAYQRQHQEHFDSPLDGPQITNIEVYRFYIESYLKNRKDINHDGMPFLVRSLAPAPAGLPIEVYIFVRTTEWEKYEMVQAEIFDHILAAAPYFDLRVFQEPTGMDFATFARGAK